MLFRRSSSLFFKYIFPILILISYSNAWTTIFKVNSTADTGTGTLRQALNELYNSSTISEDIIEFDLDGINPTILLEDSLSVVRPNASNVTMRLASGKSSPIIIDGNNKGQVFLVEKGNISINIPLTIKNAIAIGGEGGSVNSVAENAGGGGGGMGAGGAIFVNDGATVNINSSLTLSSNNATGGHGGDGGIAPPTQKGSAGCGGGGIRGSGGTGGLGLYNYSGGGGGGGYGNGNDGDSGFIVTQGNGGNGYGSDGEGGVLGGQAMSGSNGQDGANGSSVGIGSGGGGGGGSQGGNGGHGGVGDDFGGGGGGGGANTIVGIAGGSGTAGGFGGGGGGGGTANTNDQGSGGYGGFGAGGGGAGSGGTDGGGYGSGGGGNGSPNPVGTSPGGGGGGGCGYGGAVFIKEGGNLNISGNLIVDSLNSAASGMAGSGGSNGISAGSAFYVNNQDLSFIFSNASTEISINKDIHIDSGKGITVANKDGFTSTGSSVTLDWNSTNSYTGTTKIDNRALLGLFRKENLGSSSGIEIGNKAILKFHNDMTIDQPIELTESIAYIHTNNHDITLSGDISGSGSLEKTDNKSLTLSGGLSYTGSTIVSKGILITSQLLSSSAGLEILDGATCDLLGGQNTIKGLSGDGTLTIPTTSLTVDTPTEKKHIFNGTISSPSGTLIKTGNGTLELTNTNSMSGGVNLEEGVLEITKKGAVGSKITLKGGTFKITPPLLHYEDFNFATDIYYDVPSVIDISRHHVTFSLPSIGTSGFSKQGKGKLTIDSNYSTIAGDVTIDEGDLKVTGTLGTVNTVIVNAAGRLLGNGTVFNVTNQGTVAPGASIGTLNIAGDYVQDSSGELEIEVNANGPTDLLNVAGTVTLDGTVNVVPEHGSYTRGLEYIFIESGGLISGEFSTLNISDPDLLGSIFYTDHSVYLRLLNHQFFLGNNLKERNPRNVELYLESLPMVSNSDLLDVVFELSDLDENALSTALDQLHCAVFGANYMVNSASNNIISSVIDHRINYYCDFCDPCSVDTGYNFWMEPFGYYVDVEERDQLTGFNWSGAGLVSGLECFVDEQKFGITGAFSSSDISWDKNKGNSDIWNYIFSLYSDAYFNKFRLNGSIAAGQNFYDTNRKINLVETHSSAKSKHDALNIGAHIGTSYDFTFMHERYITPYCEVDYSYLDEDSYSENGADILNLNIADKQSHVLRSEIGARLFKVYHKNRLCFIPVIWTSWIYEKAYESKYTLGFENEPQTLHVYSYKKPWNRAAMGINLSFKKKNITTSLKTTAELGNHYYSVNGEINLTLRF